MSRSRLHWTAGKLEHGARQHKRRAATAHIPQVQSLNPAHARKALTIVWSARLSLECPRVRLYDPGEGYASRSLVHGSLPGEDEYYFKLR
jgi:hypothetical protein